MSYHKGRISQAIFDIFPSIGFNKTKYQSGGMSSPPFISPSSVCFSSLLSSLPAELISHSTLANYGGAKAILLGFFKRQQIRPIRSRELVCSSERGYYEPQGMNNIEKKAK